MACTHDNGENAVKMIRSSIKSEIVSQFSNISFEEVQKNKDLIEKIEPVNLVEEIR